MQKMLNLNISNLYVNVKLQFQLIKKEKVVKKIITLFTCFFLVLGFAQTSSAESDTLKKT